MNMTKDMMVMVKIMIAVMVVVMMVVMVSDAIEFGAVLCSEFYCFCIVFVLLSKQLSLPHSIQTLLLFSFRLLPQ